MIWLNYDLFFGDRIFSKIFGPNFKAPQYPQFWTSDCLLLHETHNYIRVQILKNKIVNICLWEIYSRGVWIRPPYWKSLTGTCWPFFCFKSNSYIIVGLKQKETAISSKLRKLRNFEICYDIFKKSLKILSVSVDILPSMVCGYS